MKMLDRTTYQFNGNEAHYCWIWFWDVIVDLSFWGRCEMLWRVLFNRPPKDWWEETEEK